MPSGYVVYLGRSIGKHKMLDHCTDMLRGIMLSALTVQKEGLDEELDVPEAMWAETNPFRQNWSGAWMKA